MAYSFDFDEEIIDITSPQTEVDVQELIDAIRTAEAGELGIQYDKIADASGKESLGEGVSVGITVELLGDWQLRFWSGSYIAKIAGGNLVGGPSGDPIAYSAGVQVLLIQSAASTIVETGGSALTETESNQLMGLPAAGEIADAVADEALSEHTTAGSLGAAIRFIHQIEGGRWQIADNQMIFYDADNETEIARFNLFDSGGDPTVTDVFDRQRV